MKRNCAVGVPLGSGHFSAAQAAADHNASAFGPSAHGSAHSLFHGPPEGYALFQLGGNGFGHQLRIQFRNPDFHNVNVGLPSGQFVQLLAQALNTGAAAADDNARLGGVDGYAHAVGGPFNLNSGYPRVGQLPADEIPDLDVFVQGFDKLFAFGIPPGVPVPDNANPQADGVNLLSH